MIVKSLSTITKCARTSLQTPSQINQFVTRTLVSGVDDIVRVGKNIKTIKFNEFTNILKRNGLDDFVTQEDFINFVRFNQDNKNLAQMLDDPKALTTFFQRSRKMVETAKYCDEDIYKILKNGFTEINGVNVKTSVNPNILSDMESIIHTGRYFPQYATRDTAKILVETKIGDVFSINGKMFLNNGKGIEELAFDEKMYTKFFPAISRFNSHQGKIGNCYFISQLEALMNSGKGRCHIYRMFSRDQAGNLFVQTASNKSKIRIDIDNLSKLGNIPHQNGTGLGLTSLELAYGAGIHGTPISRLSDITPQMLMNEGGWIQGGKIGLKQFAKDTNVELYDIDCGRIRKNLIDYLKKYANRDDCILQTKFAQKNPKYNILQGHAYSIKSFSEKDGTITLTNPHRAGLDITVPIEELGLFERFIATAI